MPDGVIILNQHFYGQTESIIIGCMFLFAGIIIGLFTFNDVKMTWWLSYKDVLSAFVIAGLFMIAGISCFILLLFVPHNLCYDIQITAKANMEEIVKVFKFLNVTEDGIFTVIFR